MNRTGNHLCNMDDKDPAMNPDDWEICLDCGKARHKDDVDHGTCRECFEVQEHEYYCKTCSTEFKYYGIPVHCLRGHYDIDFNTRKVDGWLEGAQEEHLKKLEAEPSETMKAIEAIKATNS